MSKLVYYKERIWNRRICKICGVPFKVDRESYYWNLHLCYVHRKEFFKKLYESYSKEYQKKYGYKYKVIRYEVWKKWVIRYLPRRRLQALTSYHRNKFKESNKARKHRRTRPVPVVEVLKV